jgi:hypothetical protein
VTKAAINPGGPGAMNENYGTKEIFHATGNFRNGNDTESHPQNGQRSLN